MIMKEKHTSWHLIWRWDGKSKSRTEKFLILFYFVFLKKFWFLGDRKQREKMYKTVAYLGKEILGEVEIYPQQQGEGGEGEEKNKKVFDEIRISYFSEASERCPPLAVLHTITASGICFKMESKSSDNIQLHLLHSSCIRENKVY